MQPRQSTEQNDNLQISEQPPASHNGHEQLHRHRKLLIGGIFASVILAIIALSGIWYLWQLMPLKTESHQQRVTVRSGDSLQVIGKKLEDDGIIRNGFVFYTFGRLQGVHQKLQAGTYVFSPSQSVGDILNHLEEGKVDQLRVTIVPGRTLKQLQSDFREYGFNDREITEAFSGSYPNQILKDRPAGATLEGYIYPETYDMPGDGSISSLIALTLDEFEKKISESSIRQKLEARKMTLHQGIILASIIQKEVPGEADQLQISQIFHKRLGSDMPLGADATFVYAAEQLNVEPKVKLESPYNTRINKGLPPGPIGNFNMSALIAAANPAPGNYLYFVSGDDGTTHFAETLPQHEQNIQKYCKKLCELF